MTFGIVAVLVVSETAAYLRSSSKEHIVVDPTVGERMSIHFDVTFHALMCSEVNMDALDIAGQQSDGIEHDIRKQRISANGAAVGWPFVYHLPVPDTQAVLGGTGIDKKQGANSRGYCGSCYGAETPERPCCNTCHILKAAYLDKGWSVAGLEAHAAQCVKEAALHQDEGGKPGEGCRTWGVIKVNKVAGTLYAAMGETHIKGYRHVHQFNPAKVASFNISHTIHDLSFFGDHRSWLSTLAGRLDLSSSGDARERNPLDGRHFSAEHGTGMVHYYTKVVPMSTDGKSAIDSQYAVNSIFRAAVVDGVRQNILPGVYFVYDLSPFMVTVENTSESIITFLMQLFAIIGGVVATLRMLDSIVDVATAGLAQAASIGTSLAGVRKGRNMI